MFIYQYLSWTCVFRAAWLHALYSAHFQLFVICPLSPNTHMHAVLSELYQKKLLTFEDISLMRKEQYTPDMVVLVQCVKSPEVVAKTADLLNTLNCTEEAMMLRG